MENMEIWWEPCVVKVSPFCLLPDTICGECTENVDNFYLFVKNCLQNIIILENQYNIQESSLKSKQKRDKGCHVDFSDRKINKGIQTDDFLDVLAGKNYDLDKFRLNFPQTVSFLNNEGILSKNNLSLVDYDIDTDSSLEESVINNGNVILGEKLRSLTEISKFVDSVTNTNSISTKSLYFDDTEKNLISEISQRKGLKRKSDFIKTSKPKIFKLHTSNRRKNKIPMKLDTQGSGETSSLTLENEKINTSQKQSKQLNDDSDTHRSLTYQDEKVLSSLPQSCLLCDTHFSGPASLASHVFEAHGIDMAEVVSSGSGESLPERSRKKIPNLVKISDLKRSDSIDDQSSDRQREPPMLHPNFVCPNCPGIFTSKQDLMMHLRLKHVQLAAYLCGICLTQCTSYMNLKSHLQICSQQHQITTKYICQVCQYGDDNFKWLENHVLVHDFLLETCKKLLKMFDPEDYIDTNENVENVGLTSISKSFSCNECGASDFQTFKEFSTHRRNIHSIFHCDLCNKFYGRNSHLWKHVNRLHKGHPSITCQLCYKTSASKYHLSQHFNKIHLTKTPKQKSSDAQSVEKDFLPQLSECDIQTLDHIVAQEQNSNISDQDYNFHSQQSDAEDELIIKQELFQINEEPLLAPKEIDSSHDLYTNIITNYTPPVNEGDYKCPKCSKAFHKKVLLKKHKKNCRPKMQKDLLTRCKTCSRIFKDRQSLTKHLVNYHSEYTCEICNEKVQSKCEIISHIRFRHPGCDLFCKICENILRSKYDLQEHIQNHLDSYICQFCGDPLPSKIKLKMHILSLHRKILSLSCGICLKLFETQHILRDHVRLVHKAQLTPLTSCPVCGKNYGSKWKTYDHLNKSHGRIFKACKTCLEVFDNEAQLQAHCDVTAHGSQSTNVTATTIRNSIMAHITSAINEVAANNEIPADNETQNVEESDSDEEVESDSEYENIDNEQYIEEPKLLLSQDKKISLLEKRLLGKNPTEDDCFSRSDAQLTSFKGNKPISETKKPLTIITKEEDPERNLSPCNPPTNSSKRTVYVNSNDPSYCEICFKTWPAKKHLWQHYIRCHKAVAATVCGICLKTNENYENLQKHLRENHPTLLHGQGFGSNFICRICGRYHNASSKLRLHMVIHENFDWKLVEDVKESAKQINNSTKPTNGYNDVKGKPQQEDFEDTINYESLIEQVECSSQSDNEESETECLQNEIKEEQDSSSDEDSDDSASSEISDHELFDIVEKKQSANEKQDYVSTGDESNSSCTDEQNAVSKSNSSEDDCSQGSQSLSSQSKFNNGSNTNSADSTLNSNIFRRKPEELDSAIKSISYECPLPVNVNAVQDYCELQSNCLNENEIESAVGSIL
ncbi:uncharacterized protein isoform X2 [Leptinotarsa decemlineata]|uniref:uncharacterized protein isoform X2 n=1 Tax=Leptinotarsa decemlineata TaxID=7539 RepID=UPI003D306EB1